MTDYNERLSDYTDAEGGLHDELPHQPEDADVGTSASRGARSPGADPNNDHGSKEGIILEEFQHMLLHRVSIKVNVDSSGLRYHSVTFPKQREPADGFVKVPVVMLPGKITLCEMVMTESTSGEADSYNLGIVQLSWQRRKLTAGLAILSLAAMRKGFHLAWDINGGGPRSCHEPHFEFAASTKGGLSSAGRSSKLLTPTPFSRTQLDSPNQGASSREAECALAFADAMLAEPPALVEGPGTAPMELDTPAQPSADEATNTESQSPKLATLTRTEKDQKRGPVSRLVAVRLPSRSGEGTQADLAVPEDSERPPTAPPGSGQSSTTLEPIEISSDDDETPMAEAHMRSHTMERPSRAPKPSATPSKKKVQKVSRMADEEYVADSSAPQSADKRRTKRRHQAPHYNRYTDIDIISKHDDLQDQFSSFKHRFEQELQKKNTEIRQIRRRIRNEATNLPLELKDQLQYKVDNLKEQISILSGRFEDETEEMGRKQGEFENYMAAMGLANGSSKRKKTVKFSP